MTAEEAVAGLVLCACELLRSARGIDGGAPPLTFSAEKAPPDEGAVSSSFSERRFLELGGNEVRPEALDSEREADSAMPESTAGETEAEGFSAMLLNAVKTIESAGGGFDRTLGGGLFDDYAPARKASLRPDSPAPTSAPRRLYRRPRGERGGGDAAFDAERFSEYMERDGRRYDSGFEYY